jgi:hypothetical protein
MARLSTGELAVGVKAKKAQCELTSEVRLNILRRALSGDVGALRHLTHFLNFTELCSWSQSSIGVVSISPKTLRAYIEQKYVGGLEAFRSDVQKAANQSNSRNKKTVKNGEEKSTSKVDQVLEVTNRYLDILDRFVKMSENRHDVRRELDAHFRKFGDLRSQLSSVK